MRCVERLLKLLLGCNPLRGEETKCHNIFIFAASSA